MAAPTGTITVPEITVGEPTTITWTMSDSDGDTVRATKLVRYISNDGADYESTTLFSTSQTSTSYTERIPLSGGENSIYYVLTITDGTNTTTVQSDTVTVTRSCVYYPPYDLNYSSPRAGRPLNVSWICPKDPDLYTSRDNVYEIQRKINNSGRWETIAYIGRVSANKTAIFVDTVPLDCTTVAYRVRTYEFAYDVSEWVTGSTLSVASPINIIGNVTISGIAKELSGGYVNIGGTWKEILSEYNNIDGVWKQGSGGGSQDTSVYSVETASGASYGFALNEDGYYESQNQTKGNSAAVCVVTLNLTSKSHVIFNCINYAQSWYDYGILSNLDTTLSTTYSADSSNVKKSFRGSSSSSVQVVPYHGVAAGTHTIYVKYIKNAYTNQNNDSLQFKIIVQEVV